MCRDIEQRGQVMLLYALLIPVLVLFVGVGLDLGWYYLNVSRLQNAADAAALAGARALIKDDENFSEYDSDAIYLVDTFYADEGNETGTSLTTEIGDKEAAAYVLKNLSFDTDALTVKNTNNITSYTITDSWGIGGSSEIKMTPNIYKVGQNSYYVIHLAENVQHLFLPGWFDFMNAPVIAIVMLTKPEVTTDGSLKLVFESNGGSFGDTTTSTKNLNSLEKITENKELVTVSSDYGSPTLNGYEFLGWNTIADNSGTYIYDGKQLVASEVAKLFGEEQSVTLYAVWKKSTTTTTEDTSTTERTSTTEDTSTGGSDSSGGNDSDSDNDSSKGNDSTTETTSKNGGGTSTTETTPPTETRKPMNNITLWQQMEYVRAKNAYDGDWSVSYNKYKDVYGNVTMKYIQFSKTTAKSLEIKDTELNKSKITDVNRLFLDFYPESTSYSELRNPSKRPHALINVNAAYDVRSGKNDDPLYIRIESEPAHNANGGNQGNPPQQIIININVSNLATDKRPLIFYYDGPLEDREPMPVILNLNADFKGVLYMPDVPVVINGNGKGVGDGSGTNHTFEGFIIAKEFRALDKTYSTSTAAYTVNSKRTTYKVDSKNNVQTFLVDGDYLALRDKLEQFYLSSASKFRRFNIETDLEFTYIHYDADGDMVPLTDRDEEELIPLYDKNGTRITDWDKVKLYDKPATDSSRTQYPKKDTAHARVPLLDSDGKPVPLYDEYGNKIYFCEDYGRLGLQYNLLTLHKVSDGTRKPHEFLLTKTESNSDDWI